MLEVLTSASGLALSALLVASALPEAAVLSGPAAGPLIAGLGLWPVETATAPALRAGTVPPSQTREPIGPQYWKAQRKLQLRDRQQEEIGIEVSLYSASPLSTPWSQVEEHYSAPHGLALLPSSPWQAPSPSAARPGAWEGRW